jgi:outer membrane protein TolC
MPSITLSASGGDVVSNLLPSDISSAGAGLVAPLFDGGRLRAQRDTALERRDQAAFALTAFSEVSDALAAAERLSQQEQDVVAQRDALAEAYRLASNRYRAGYAPYLDQLDAQRSPLSAELQLVQPRTERLDAAVALYKALGGGWVAGQEQRVMAPR